MRKRRRFWAGVVISVLFLLFALRGQRLPEVWQGLREANYWWLIPGIIVYFFAVWLRTFRWHYLLRPVKTVSLRSLFPVVTIGYMGNNIFPFRAGEVIRAYLLRGKEDVSASASLATIVVERVFDGITMLVFVFAVLPLVPTNEFLSRLLPFMSFLFFGALAAFLLIASSPQRTERVYQSFVSKLVPQRWRDQVSGLLERFIEGLQVLRSWRDILLIMGISILLWLVEAWKYWFVMQGFAFDQPFYVLVFTCAIVNLATTIPATPGYLGTFEVAGIESLVLFGVPRHMATSFMLALHAALWFPITAVGAYFAWRESISWREMEEMRVTEREATAPVPALKKDMGS
ncbi:MAG: flippase-like domain-containing protein [Anaerolineae bacterium]|nr:flippase-like domain-containing protein [Anaerolineae bacterium]NIN95985.1 flippase-like domain-containing protein [Anaerolineae bacterium]NIQ79017.1 flippase-like domain-containing protein [Anaerolineae bacterium]